MNDPQLWWYVTRASALIAWVLLTLSVVWGVLLSTRILRKVDDAGRLQDLHRFLGSLALIMIGLHLVSLVLDPWAHFSAADLFLPLESAYRPIPVAIGIIALYLLLVAYGSSLLRNRLPPRFWKGLHYANYAAVLGTSFHAGLAGTDSGRWWYLSLAVTLISLTAVAVVVRLVLSSRVEPAAKAAAKVSGPAATTDTRLPSEPREPTAARTPGLRPMVVIDVTDIAEGVRRIRLAPLGGGPVPDWEPGGHLTLELPNGLGRQYSLCGDPAEHRFLEIAVLRDPGSRGGSAWIHDALTVGMTIPIREPENHFRLAPAAHYVFVAGGIGITPLRAMIDALPARREWTLLYLGRRRDTMAYLPELLAEHPDRVFAYARDEHEERLDVAGALQLLLNPESQVYCCGPEELIDAVRAVSPTGRFHAEHFVPVARPEVTPTALTVDCVRSGVSVTVGPEVSVLAALEARGIPVVASCRRGVCGSCELRVVDGVPQHLDSVLDDAEKDEIGVMYPCVSRALGDRLALDV